MIKDGLSLERFGLDDEPGRSKLAPVHAERPIEGYEFWLSYAPDLPACGFRHPPGSPCPTFRKAAPGEGMEGSAWPDRQKKALNGAAKRSRLAAEARGARAALKRAGSHPPPSGASPRLVKCPDCPRWVIVPATGRQGPRWRCPACRLRGTPNRRAPVKVGLRS